MKEWLRAFMPHQPLASFAERARAAVGALLGLALTSVLTLLVAGRTDGMALLIAPMGASAVLLFAVPASPLAQPWSMLGGNVVSAIMGVSCALLIRDPLWAAPAAVAAAIAAMSLFRCMHPPGGAVALTAVIGGPGVLAAGYEFVWSPVLLNSALLLGAALVYNNLTRRPYPHVTPVPAAHRTSDPPSQDRVGYTPADIDEALKHFGQLLDVDRDDLDALFREVEAQAHRRLHGEITCAAIMSRDVVTVSPDSSTGLALALLRAHTLNVLPVVDAEGRLVGRVGYAELAESAGDVLHAMSDRIERAAPETAIDRLLPLLSRGHVHEVMIQDGDGRLVGVVTQTDLLAALYRSHVVEAVAGRGPAS